MCTTVLFCGLLLLIPSLSSAKLYQWTDTQGVIHVVDESGDIPAAYRDQVKVHQTARPAPSSTSLPLSPSRTYPKHSEGKFAQKLALDLGLIKKSNEDGLGPLSGAGIHPAGGWEVSDLLTSEVVDDVLATVRRAADSQRLALSADGAEAVVKQVAAAILPPPPPVREQEPRQEPQVIIYEAPQEIIEVERERYYDPVFVPVPVIEHRHHHHHRHDREDENFHDSFTPTHPTGPHTTHWGERTPRTRHSPSGQHTTNPIPPHSPSQMPFGSVSQMPFGSVSQMPFGTAGRATRR
ncbi:MAG: DUF4124 domain-containing protein [Deltaproteobacteria bacterium]|nr:DUF4124 domain-containing protein [Deltaproteobacteria bacterium]